MKAMISLFSTTNILILYQITLAGLNIKFHSKRNTSICVRLNRITLYY